MPTLAEWGCGVVLGLLIALEYIAYIAHIGF